MAPGSTASKRNVECRTKVKTGCTTCRIRKIKCDEHKPLCKRCVSTGRSCDGYESPFRLSACQPTNRAHAGTTKSVLALQPIRANLLDVTAQDVDLLNYYFSTKTMLDVKLACDEEARQVLEASLTDPTVRHAILSLKALREDLETFGDGPACFKQQTPSHHYGLQQYNIALGCLASKLSSPGSNVLKSALLCCQVFISIEQVRKNYAAMAQHIIRGLRIMHEYRARPELVDANKIVPAHHKPLPFLDVFIIKLFAAPCKVGDAPALSVNSISPQQPPGRSEAPPVIAPDKRTELKRISASTLEFLRKVSRVESVEVAFQLLREKAALLSSLESWLVHLEVVQAEIGCSVPEPISVSFLRIFHLILKICLLGTLNSSPGLDAQLQTENARLQDIANNLGDRLSTYRMCNGTSSRPGEDISQRANINWKVT